MKTNKQALSLVIAIGLALVMGLLTLYILEYMVPFLKNTKGIEQSVGAYYQADSGVEKALLSMKDNSDNLAYEYNKDFDSLKKIDFKVKMTTSGTKLPPDGQGDSEFDKNFNTIQIGNPIQIEIGNGMITNFDEFKFYFKVPNFDNDITTDEKLKEKDDDGNDIKYINWQISSEDDTLNASGSQIISSNINGSDIVIKDFVGRDLSDNEKKISDFYSGNCNGTNSGCILKMSVINKLELINGNQIPYLEWKIDTGGDSIPLRYRIVETEGKDYSFKKFLKVRVPQNTLNQAFDFTVFQ